MDAARWKRVEDVFGQVLDADEGARPDVLARACQGDAALRAEVESLLAGELQAADTLHAAVALATERFASHHRAARIGRRLGSYRLVGVLGEGGMRVVCRAERDDGVFRRDVAIRSCPMASSPRRRSRGFATSA